jgi:DNA-binding NarL/FixJ family response regulator
LRQIRLFIGDIPRLLRDILKSVMQEQPDMVVVGCGGYADFLAALERLDIDVVILGQGAGDTAAAMRRLFTARPGLKVLIVPNDERFSEMFELRRLFIVEPSPQMLVDAIRSLL